jgi:hypothetical protein
MQATAWRSIDRIDGQHGVWRCSAPKQAMELLMFFDQVEINFAIYNYVELQIQSR